MTIEGKIITRLEFLNDTIQSITKEWIEGEPTRLLGEMQQV